MRNKNKPVELPGYEDIFVPSDAPANDGTEKITDIPLSDLFAYEGHPFKVKDDSEMINMTESIKQFGVLVPGVVRLREAGGYEIISGHRRKRACELAELQTMPVIIRDIDNDESIIALVDSNLQREVVLPSEKAFAYKMKLEAMKRRAGRRTKNSEQLEQNLSGRVSRDILGEESGDSGVQVSRYIRLTELIPELLSRVDEKIIAFSPAVELSYLKKEEQQILLEVIELLESTPSLSQAQKLKKYSQKKLLTFETIESMMATTKSDSEKLTLKSEILKKYFPTNFTPLQMEKTIITLLENWVKNQNNQK
jgi:ParB family chromosome partitioning protein